MHDELRPATLAGSRLDKYFHTCAFIRGGEEEYRILTPFLSEGLAWGEKAVYIVDPQKKPEHTARLEAAGLQKERKDGQLDVLDWNETYLLEGRFDRERMLAAVQGTIAAGREQGFVRSRIVGQMDWVLAPHPGVEEVLEYEVQVNDVLARTRHPAVCVYDLDKLSGSMVMDLLRVHPMSIVGGTLYENPFYQPAEAMLRELRQRRAAAH